jgi:hypothetical protein
MTSSPPVGLRSVAIGSHKATRKNWESPGSKSCILYETMSSGTSDKRKFVVVGTSHGSLVGLYHVSIDWRYRACAVEGERAARKAARMAAKTRFSDDVTRIRITVQEAHQPDRPTYTYDVERVTRSTPLTCHYDGQEFQIRYDYETTRVQP